jgi:putative flavoprotein involved in K+ transport
VAGRTDVAVIGAGQAGLAGSAELRRAGIDHVVFERDRIGSSWTSLWDSFRLNTPSWSLQLPGMAYDGDEPDGFMPRSEIVEHLERYGAQMEAPVTEGVDVRSIDPTEDGFRLSTSDGPWTAKSVIVGTGAYQRSYRPPGIGELPPGIETFDTRTYRSPNELPGGAVLIMGSGQSGCQIAEDLADAGREVILSCGKAVWAPRRIAGHDLLWWLLETGFMDGTVASLPTPAARLAANVTASGVGGGHDLHPRALQAKGVTLTGHSAGFADGRFRFDDDLGATVAWDDDRYREVRAQIERLSAARELPDPDLPEPEPFLADAPSEIDAGSVGSVIVSGGFRPDYSWIRVPDVVDEMGFPSQVDGASTASPGLFFLGVHFLRKRRSSLLCGVGEDAAIVAQGVRRHLAGDGGVDGRPNSPGPST